MRVVAISDLHGHLPRIEPCDLLLIAGDICPVADHSLPAQRAFLDGPLRGWLDSVPAEHVVATWGNHDFIGQEDTGLVPADLRWEMLVDRSVVIDGRTVYGSPWQPIFANWAFEAREHELCERWSAVPADTLILVTHCPPYGYGDSVPHREGARHQGSPSLTRRLLELRVRLAVFGHIHEGRGTYRLDDDVERDTILANVTILDAAYRAVYDPMAFEI